jgi:hypothetical protein
VFQPFFFLHSVLSDLEKKEGQNRCSTFVRLNSMAYVTGSYPKALLKLWDDFADERGELIM